MNEFVSRRALIGALGASALLPSLSGAQTFTPANVPAGSRELWSWVHAQLVLDPDLAWLDTAGSAPALRAVMVREYRSRERQSHDFHRYQASVLGAESCAATWAPSLHSSAPNRTKSRSRPVGRGARHRGARARPATGRRSAGERARAARCAGSLADRGCAARGSSSSCRRSACPRP
jgi:hypothetical protein